MIRSDAATTTGRGAWAEARAERHLTARGLRLVRRNYRARRGEIDLVMRDAETLVFVEVRYRRRGDFGTPLETVGPAKRTRLIQAAEQFLLEGGPAEPPPCRFDVVAVTGDDDGGGDQAPRVEWIRDAFRG